MLLKFSGWIIFIHLHVQCAYSSPLHIIIHKYVLNVICNSLDVMYNTYGYKYKNQGLS